MRNNKLTKILIILLISVLIFSGCASKSQTQTQAVGTKYLISMDINPSISIAIEEDIVTAVKAYNDDGQELILNANVIGLNSEEAVKLIIQELIDLGYITESESEDEDKDEAYLLIAIASDAEYEEKISKQVKEYVKNALEENDTKCEVQTTQTTAEVVALAESYNLSAGRYLILQAISENEGITLEEAIELYGSMKLKVLNEMFEYIHESLDDDRYEYSEYGIESVTPEQQQLIKPALAAFKDSVKAAKRQFQTEFKALKDQYLIIIKTLREEYRKGDKVELQQKLDEQKAQMLAEYEADLDAMYAKIETARTVFKAAVAESGISEEVLDIFLDNILAEELDIDEDYGEFMNEFLVDDDDEDDEDEDDEDDDEDDEDDDEDEDDDDDDEDRDGNHKDDDQENGEDD